MSCLLLVKMQAQVSSRIKMKAGSQVVLADTAAGNGENTTNIGSRRPRCLQWDGLQAGMGQQGSPKHPSHRNSFCSKHHSFYSLKYGSVS